MDTATGDRDVWKELGAIAFQRRQELDLSVEEMASYAGVSAGTIWRLESGHRQSRRGTTWGKLETGYGWGPGFIENFTTGRVTEPPRTEGDGQFVRTPRPDGDEDIRDIVNKIFGQYAPSTPIGDVLKAEEAAVAEARKRGLIWDTKETQGTNENSITP